MVANARAIAQVAKQSGNSEIATNYTRIADKLEQAMYDKLWDPTQEFFIDVIQPNNPNLSKIMGREEVGLYPFRFGIGLNARYSNASIQKLFDPQGFLTPYGPTTLEVQNQYYFATKLSDYCCYWNGQSWPFSTAHTLNHSPPSFDLRIRLLQQRITYNIWIDMQPLSMKMDADSSNHSEHYDHSTNNDDVITGILGIIPRPDDILEISPLILRNWTYFAVENLAYHGYLVTILYDKDGSRYQQGSGLTVLVNGNKSHSSSSAFAKIPLPQATAAPISVPINISANPNGLGSYPQASATYTYTSDNPYKAIDGYLFYDSVPDSRWTNYQSQSPNDTLQVTFARPRNISSVTLALFSDVARNGSIDVPASIEIYGSEGLLTSLSNKSFIPNDRNTFHFDEIETDCISVNMFNKPGAFVGVCELEVWVPDQMTSKYYAVDALLTGAVVVYDGKSAVTPKGAVVGNLSDSSVVAFSGVKNSGRSVQLSFKYSNSGESTVSVDVKINQVLQKRLDLAKTGANFASATMTTTLSAGNNFITLLGGTAGIKYDLLEISEYNLQSQRSVLVR
ncbi:Six-hairpin glycosidase-like protein [Cadophora sp. MPI-SDFR-AT-0126]|nr:Six-hairpin glycosidase-like protein [Leotiomycetes sp. MPI-SDFR-AT-0126]